jgi:signal peptidase
MQFRTSENRAVSLARDLLWVIAVVGSIALALFLICGTWPAVVTIESGSMIPHMNIGDLVVVVDKDRFGNHQTWDDGRVSGYKKFGDYGDVFIYRPNGYTDTWPLAGLLPLPGQRPIIHRAMTWTEAGEPVPLYINIYRGSVTPAGYLPLTVAGTTTDGYQILSTGNTTPVTNYSAGNNDLPFPCPQLGGNCLLRSDSVVKNAGYVINTSTVASHGGYITKGDNNNVNDQGSLPLATGKTLEPVQNDWIVGKALFAIPYIGLLPLYIREVIVIVIILKVLHEIWRRRKDENGKTAVKQVKKGKKQR